MRCEIESMNDYCGNQDQTSGLKVDIPEKPRKKNDAAYFIGLVYLKIAMIMYSAEKASQHLEADRKCETREAVQEVNKYAKCIQTDIENEKTSDRNKDNAHSMLIHDVVSIVTAVVCFSQNAVDCCEDRNLEELSRILLTIRKCASIASQRIRETHTFLGLESEVFYDLYDAINLALELSESRKKEAGSVNITINVPLEPVKITKNIADFSCMLMNLFNNAFQAFAALKEDQTEKTLQIDACLSGGQLEIKVCDNAGGIPEKVVEKVFNPFFTTKEKGQGKGIGLYFCKEFIERSGGSIGVVSKFGIGTTFVLCIPV